MSDKNTKVFQYMDIEEKGGDWSKPFDNVGDCVHAAQDVAEEGDDTKKNMDTHSKMIIQCVRNNNEVLYIVPLCSFISYVNK